MAKETYQIGVLDYVIVVGSLVLCVGIGFCSGFKRKKKANENKNEVSEYLLGGRQMAMIPVAFSIMATIMSGNSIAGHIGEMYVYGISSVVAIFGAIVAKIFCAYTIVPVFHNLPYTSIYEVLYLGTVLYGPAISITTVTGIPYWATSLVVGLICTGYCIMGGLKAVVWTDVSQALLMFACVILVTIMSTLAAGGFGKVVDIAFAPGVQHFYIIETLHIRYSIWSLFLNGVSFTIKSSVMGQAGAQRVLSVKNHNVARHSLLFSAFLSLLFKVFVVLSAIGIYACFYNCDPLQRTEETGIHSPDQIYIYAVARQMHDIPGLQGLALAGLLSASLSTCSSFINSFATITLEDFIKPFKPEWVKTQARQIFICKVFTTVYGAISILASLAIPYMGGIVKVNLGLTSAVLGPLAGVMLAALFWWRAGAKSCKYSMLFGVLFMVWMSIGSVLYPMKSDTLPLSTDGCPADNNTMAHFMSANISTESSIPYKYIEPTEKLMTFKNETAVPKGWKQTYKFLFPGAYVSFMWFGTLGLCSTVILMVVFSFVGKPEFVDPKLLTPIAAKSMLRCQKQNNNKRAMGTSDINIISDNFTGTRM